MSEQTQQLQATLERVNADIARATGYYKRGEAVPPDLVWRLIVWGEGYRELLRQQVKDAEDVDAPPDAPERPGAAESDARDV